MVIIIIIIIIITVLKSSVSSAVEEGGNVIITSMDMVAFNINVEVLIYMCLIYSECNCSSRVAALRIHISETTKELLDEFETFIIQERGPVDLKVRHSVCLTNNLSAHM